MYILYFRLIFGVVNLHDKFLISKNCMVSGEFIALKYELCWFTIPNLILICICISEISKIFLIIQYIYNYNIFRTVSFYSPVCLLCALCRVFPSHNKNKNSSQLPEISSSSVISRHSYSLGRNRPRDRA